MCLRSQPFIFCINWLQNLHHQHSLDGCAGVCGREVVHGRRIRSSTNSTTNIVKYCEILLVHGRGIRRNSQAATIFQLIRTHPPFISFNIFTSENVVQLFIMWDQSMTEERINWIHCQHPYSFISYQLKFARDEKTDIWLGCKKISQGFIIPF